MACSDDESATITAAKSAMRTRLLRRRRELPEPVRAWSAERLQAALLAALPLRHGLTVAAYSPLATEPGGRLPQVLSEAGHTVLLPITLPDNDLDWAAYEGELAPAGRGLREPVGERLGPEAVSRTDMVVVPALAVGPDGQRLGRGGGSYDRALARVGDTAVVALLFDDEYPCEVPGEPHDRLVSHVVTPSGGYTAICRQTPPAP